MYDLTERVPIRLVQENGDRIDLDVHTMDVKIHRIFQAFPIPFTGGFNAGVDLNQASVEIELQGVFADDPGQEESRAASATIEFGFGTPPFGDVGEGTGQSDAESHPPTNEWQPGRVDGVAGNLFARNPIIPTFPPSQVGEERRVILAGLHGRYFDLPLAYRASIGPAVPPNGDYVRFVFDSHRSGSVKEPFAYPRAQLRDTDLIAASSNSITSSADGYTLILSIASGDPRTWFETPDSWTNDRVGIQVNNTRLSFTVTGVTSNSIEFVPEFGITTSTSSFVNGGTVEILNLNTELGRYSRASDVPIVAIPIRHMFDENPPNFADGSARSVGTASSPGEVLAYVVSEAIKSTTALTVGGISDIEVAPAGFELSDAFSTELVTSDLGVKTTVKISQKYAFDLGSLGQISTNIPAHVRPVINPFTGGKTGNRVKSAGDKVQDILGIVANSQNFAQNNSGTMIGNAMDYFTRFSNKYLDQRPSDILDSGDYITGIQIPYDSWVTLGMATLGPNVLDSNIAQRNFFTTYGDKSIDDKSAVANRIHASRPFFPSGRGHATNGIKAVVTDFIAMHDAQERLYNFVIKMIAVDSLL